MAILLHAIYIIKTKENNNEIQKSIYEVNPGSWKKDFKGPDD